MQIFLAYIKKKQYLCTRKGFGMLFVQDLSTN